jgi:hypothetical protein
MRRILFTAVASLAILAIAPASVLAKHHSKRHHARTHHSRIRHERFGVITPTSGSSSTTTTPPVTPTDTAGTVASPVTNNTLVIKLTDGTLVSGTITPNTEIECEAADMNDASETMHSDGDPGGGGGDNNTSGGDENGGGGDQGDDNGDNNGAQNASCTSANLVMGAVVQGAELGISSAGATWDKIELVG